MMRRDDEFDAFKEKINLSEYAASIGYAIDRRESSHNSVVMRKEGELKVVITINHATGQWIYFTVGESKDNGSIIDFVKHRKFSNYGLIRKELRPWVNGGSVPRPSPTLFAKDVIPSSRDIERVIKDFHKSWVPESSPFHPYLESRSIGEEIFSMPEFEDSVRINFHGSAVFAHRDSEGLCGLEIRGKDFKGFSPSMLMKRFI